jgi:hypothetical protein
MFNMNIPNVHYERVNGFDNSISSFLCLDDC